jgi:hypothetical protein
MDEKLRTVLEGYTRANGFIQQERRAALARVTPAEAWSTFRILWGVWTKTGGNRDDMETLDALKIERLVRLRRRLDRLATRRT